MTIGEALARQIEAELYDLEALKIEAALPGPPAIEPEQKHHEAIERAVQGRRAV